MRERVACLFTRGGSLPDVVRKVLISELCEIKAGEKNHGFSIEGYDCKLLVESEYAYASLGSAASGFKCLAIIKKPETPDFDVMVLFLADVDLVERKPPTRGALIVPVC